VLGGIARVLGVGENVAVGALTGVAKDIGDLVDHPKNVPWALISPWTYIAAHSEDNFTEVAKAVRDNKTYTQWIKESQDPNSFLYKNAFVIGLGLSIFGDPTTYISFGAMSGSKIAGQKLLALAAESTAQEAMAAKAIGVIVRTGEDVSKSSYEQVFHAIHTSAGRPYSVGDAMDVLRKADKGQMPDLDPELLTKIGIGGRGPVKTAARKVFARGGRGIRFMGGEIPGTRNLGSTIGKPLRLIPGVPSGEATKDTALDFFSIVMPNEKLLRVSDDITRSVAMLEFTRVNQTRAVARSGAYESALDLFRLDPVQAARGKAQPALVRGAITVRNLFEDVPLAVPKQQRLDLLRPGYTPTGMYKNVLLDMKVKALSTKDAIIKDAQDYGLSDNAIAGLEADWIRLNNSLRDPVDVLAWWSGIAEGTIATHKLVDSIVRNPLLARPLIGGEDDLARIADEIADNTVRLERANKRLREKGISELARSKRLALVKDLEMTSGELTLRHNAVSAELKLAGQGMPTAVRSEAEFIQLFGEDAVPVTWKGTKYFVPGPVAQALEEFKNPQYITRELTKFFRAVNYTQNKWKLAATVLNPSFHIMNAVGGSWNNLLGGVYNPFNYAEQVAGMYRQRLARMDDESAIGKALGPLKTRVNPDKLARDQALGDAAEARHVGGGFVSHETHPTVNAFKAAAEPRSNKRKVFTAARRAYAATVLPLAVAPDSWVPDELEDSPLFNPLLAIGAGLPEIARAGRYVASDVETMLRQTPMRVASKDRSYFQAMEALSITPPTNFGKWMGQTDIGKDVAMREAIWDIGAANAIRYQFDYTNLTPFERLIAKTVFPFYVFNKNNFVLQAQELAQRPRFVAVAMDVGNFMNNVTATEQNQAFEELLPEYFDKLGMFRVPVPGAIRGALGLPEDQDIYLNPKLPYASLNLMPALWELFNDESITPGNNRMLQILAPIFSSVGPLSVIPGFKPMLEYSVGYNLGLARPIDYQALESGGYRHSLREAPGWMHYVPGVLQDRFGVYKDPNTGHLMMSASTRYIVEQMATPFMNSAGDVFNWGGAGIESDRNKANNFAFITGIRLTPVDPLKLQRGWLYRTQSFLEAQRSNARNRGGTFSREDQRLLTQIRRQIKVVERAYDAQQKDLYGP